VWHFVQSTTVLRIVAMEPTMHKMSGMSREPRSAEGDRRRRVSAKEFTGSAQAQSTWPLRQTWFLVSVGFRHVARKSD